MKELTIKEMPVDITAKLNSDVRKHLCDTIEKEFQNRVTIDLQVKNKRKAEIIERHKKRLGVDKKIELWKKLTLESENLKRDMEKLGFRNGEYCSGYNPEIEEEIDQLNKTAQEILTIKHKLQTRLMLSTTIGEATVIMHEILGNSLIPTLNQNAISFSGNK